MSLREFINKVEERGELLRIERNVNPKLEIARILNENSNRVVLFENVGNSNYRVVGNLCNKRENFAIALNVGTGDLLHRIISAIENPTKPEIIKNGNCQEVVEYDPNLFEIPIPTYTSRDMGPYITSGVFIANDPEYGFNMSFHRASPISKNELVARICHRDLYRYIKKSKNEIEVAICIGLDLSVLLAAAISTDIKTNELEIANSLSRVELVRCKTKDILVPADSEIVLEGNITMRKHKEGPFPDITKTYDIVREEFVIKIDCITHRRNPIFHALLPASKEHELLMGMPREPIIYNAVNEVCKCRDVLLTHGGCSWLHCVIKIDKRNEDDGKKAINAAFKAHPSMKHVVVVDNDIDIHNMEEVEWAIATRFQAGRDLIIKKEKGSSLDPSANEDRTTYKVGIDATIPFDMDGRKFKRIKLGE
ncbi:MAG: UbiD family decarboxylase [Candidatus Altiarchaeales archaeon]|nr:MAG: UbiD family decarboxylase [Candidatus Altiarchaeales archaeon]